jgi:hypothetical protein
MDPNACLYYPSQPGVTQTFPQVLLTMPQPMRGDVSAPQLILTAAFIAGPVSRFTSDIQCMSGEGTRSQVAAASTSGSQADSDNVVSNGQGGEQGFGFWPEFIYLVVTSPLLLSALSP